MSDLYASEVMSSVVNKLDKLSIDQQHRQEDSDSSGRLVQRTLADETGSVFDSVLRKHNLGDKPAVEPMDKETLEQNLALELESILSAKATKTKRSSPGKYDLNHLRFVSLRLTFADKHSV